MDEYGFYSCNVDFFALFLFYTFSFEINRLLHTIVIEDRQRSPGNNKTVNTN